MTHLGAWEVGADDVPQRMADDRVFLERNLEDWIQRDPSLLGGDIRWVARQLTLPDQSRLDLLGLTRDNEWVIAELKAGAVGGGAVEQALHYFLQLANMTNSQLTQAIRAHGISAEAVATAESALATEGEDGSRDYRLMAAGVGRGEAAEAVAAILTRYGLAIPIQVITFRLLRSIDGRRILLREVDEDLSSQSSQSDNQWSLDHVLGYAERCGVREGFEQIRSELLARGYRTYQKKWGLNFNLRSRLQCFWVTPEEGMIHIGYLTGNFPALFGVDEESVRADMGANWLHLPSVEAVERMRRWADVVERYRQPTPADAGTSPEGGGA